MPLKEINQLEILTLQDNYIDLISNDNNRIVQRAGIARNSVLENRMLAGHGFSGLISLSSSEAETHQVLFDFGSSSYCMNRNANFLEVDFSDIKTLVLSHGHQDHFAGMLSVAKKINGKDVELILHPTAFRKLRYMKDNEGNIIRIASLIRSEIEDSGITIKESSDPKLISNGNLLFLGQIPRHTEFEKGWSNFYYESEGIEKEDYIEDDSAVVAWIKNEGLIVISGCAHSGIINTVKYAQEITGVSKMYAVFGGFHLSGPNQDSNIEKTTKALKAIDPRYIIPTHCTGHKAIVYMEKEMPDKVLLNMVGTKMVFGECSRKG